ncbi:MAG: hypothetical protein HZB15_12390, partial [Actinobacteria bacterium]|nr:hypothetical protein [Actinomycetota bacterium]
MTSHDHDPATGATGTLAVGDDPVSATTHAVIEGFLALLPNHPLDAIEAHCGDELTWA